MHQKYKLQIQLGLIILLSAGTLAGISLLLGAGMQPHRASAQGPIIATPSVPFTPAPLADFGLSAADFQLSALAAVSYDLSITKTTSVTSVTSGSVVTFNISISNLSGSTAQYLYFTDSYPKQMVNVTYAFQPGVTAVSNGVTGAEQWFITSQIPVGQSIAITVTGELTSALDALVTNTAVVTPFIQGADPAGGNNSASASVNVTGFSPTAGLIFLPIVQMNPTPTPVPLTLAYHETFDGTPWQEFSNNGCSTTHNTGQYWVDLDSGDRTCLPPARNENKPELPYRTYGEFEVRAYDSGENQDSESGYGIWANGQGADNYYLFRIWPNTSGCSSGGNWELRRYKDGGNQKLLGGTCNGNIVRGYGSASANTLRLAHKSTGELLVYVNGQLLGNISDTNQLTNGTATGVYAESNNRHIRIKYDDFKVYRY
ncbi:MAG: hypothetical protein D6768_00140 [Chloroflexi bacterium]|nr:MAG: hypothetical protein D6768_00140 [Chloroflexota bacterium]